MSRFLCGVLLFLSSCCLFSITPSEAFDRLMQGNQRFQKNKATSLDSSKRQSLIDSQEPFAVVVTCADSRVAPEIVFDQGIGDLFVIRVAGNVIGPLEMESVKYAAKHLHASCILVMGHENCGAVNAVIKEQTADVRFIAQLIRPSVVKAQSVGSKDLLQRATNLNAEAMADFIKRSSMISELSSQGKIDVRSAYYHFDSGMVQML